MKEGNFFNTLFYFEIISDSKEVVKIVQRVPVYPSPSFRHDKIFTAPEHIGNTRKLTGRPTSSATPPTSPAMGGGLGVRGGEQGAAPAGRWRRRRRRSPRLGSSSASALASCVASGAQGPRDLCPTPDRPAGLPTPEPADGALGRPEGPFLCRASRGSNLLLEMGKLRLPAGKGLARATRLASDRAGLPAGVPSLSAHLLPSRYHRPPKV